MRIERERMFKGDFFVKVDTFVFRWIAPFLPPETSHSLRAMLNQLVHVGMVQIEYAKYDWSINQRLDSGPAT